MPTKKKLKVKPGATLEEMLAVATFDELLDEGHVLDIEAAAARTGYSVQHLRRLCHDHKVNHFTRGGEQYFFLPRHLNEIFKTVIADKP